MDTPDNKAPGLVHIVKSWIPRKTEPSNLSRDFWMPDRSCPVCYECDSQFTVFNRRHHCRLCGRVFCAKCAANSIPAPSGESKDIFDELERIRVCNYCYKQWEQEIVPTDNGAPTGSLHLSSSPSARSLASPSSNCTSKSSNCTAGSISEPYQTPELDTVASPHLFSSMDSMKTEQDNAILYKSADPHGSVLDPSAGNRVEFFVNRSDGEGDEYDDYNSDYAQSYSQGNDYYGAVSLDELSHLYGLQEAHDDGENIKPEILSCLPLTQEFDAQNIEKTDRTGGEANSSNEVGECEPACEESFEPEAVDYENNGLLWLPPEPENEEDERESVLFDDEGGSDGGRGEWGYLPSSDGFGDGEYHSRDKSSEEHRRAMKNVVEGHFRALVAQLLEVENLPVITEGDREGWLDIITSLSWEAATLLKPDTSKGGGMDPGGYVKIKCIPCGRCSER